MRGLSTGTRLTACALLSLGMLTGCADSLPSLPKLKELNPFAEKEVPLPGRRISVVPKKSAIPGELADASQPIALPEQYSNQSWSQPGGVASNAPGHLAFSGAARRAWSADAGEGSSKTGRVTASPIVADGRVFTLDAAGNVSAFSLGGGSAIWRTSLKPTVDPSNKPGFSAANLFTLGGDDGGGYGGGLAADGGRLFAASGYGTIVALDPSSGKRLWEKNVGAPVRASPTAAAERVFAVTTDGRTYCLAATDGTELWTARGLPQQASLTLSPSPAVDGEIVVVPYPSGDIIALNITDGTQVWSENLSTTRTTSQLAAMSDAARPAIATGVVYAVGHGGRMIATQLKTGERLWSINVGGTQTPWVAGGSVFVVDTGGRVMALGRHDGKVQWTAKLPGSNTWSGPTLAGGTLWLVSNKGQIAGVDPASGRITTQQNLGDPMYIAPVVAQNKMFVLTDKANLIGLN